MEGLITTREEKDEGGQMAAQHLERLYVFAIMWSIGALLELEDRSKLELFMREQFELDFPETDAQQTMFEFFVNDTGQYNHVKPQHSAAKEHFSHMRLRMGLNLVCNPSPSSLGEWEHWENRVEEYIYPKTHTPDYLSILVPNVDNVRTDFLINTIAKQGKVSVRLAFLLS